MRVGDPVHLRLGVQHHVGQHRGCPGPGDQEQVGKPVDAQPEVGARSVRPVIAKRRAVTADDVDLGQRSGHRVETRCKNDGIEVVVGFGGA